ncbi:ras and Rab interactor 3-like [Neolamprologus brichardi]|uniref:ras and Rab interactor 3-like n=1 Tax=Neolamprologus brichardi TaxID=32507 RepID=UPI00164397F8|nr:ras and Rab interactor 3-like [Neolamprologus brichardi]
MESASSDEIQQPIYEDPDALLPDYTHEAQPEIKVKPVPAPRLKLYQQTNSTSNKAESSNKAGSIAPTATSSGSPAGYKRPQPARPAPKPPTDTKKNAEKPAIAESASNAHSPVMTPDLHIEQAPPPPPQPHRFPASHSSCGQTCSSASQRYENTSDHQSRPSSAGSTHLTVLPALSQESPNEFPSSSTISGRNPSPLRNPDLHIKQPPPPPPRPHRFQSPPQYYETQFSASQRYENKPECQSPPSPAGSTHLTPVSQARSQESLNVTGNNYSTRNRPPQLPLNPPSSHSVSGGSLHSETPRYLEILQDDSDELDLNGLLTWFNRIITSSDSSLSLYGVSKEDEMSSVSQRSMNVAKAWRLYNLLMSKRKEDLQKIITDFKSICEKLNKIKENNKNMGIAGGTTASVGGVAAVVGIVLAPVTMGASLIATAVGAGMIASAGGMGAHAAIVSKKTVTRTAVEKLVNNYMEGVADLERCLDYIIFTVMELRRHGIARLESAGAHLDAVRMLYILCDGKSNTDIHGGRAAQPGGTSSEKLLQAFTKEMDLYFTEKNGQKLKKSNKSIFSGKVCLLVDGLQEGLDYLIDTWKKLS